LAKKEGVGVEDKKAKLLPRAVVRCPTRDLVDFGWDIPEIYKLFLAYFS
jgi:hypothetical protein